MTARSLLEYFRTHINSFIGPSAGGVSFAPYHDVPFDDADRFNSPYEASLGALISINIPGLGPNFLGDDGSVILSEYYYNASSDYARFTFTTMETPLDNEHPVAGNREFGVYADPKRLGEYTFYTMGVDRVWDLGAAFKNGVANGFERGDELWSSIQANILQYIINQGGQAEFYAPPRYTPRPNYEAVKDFLNGYGDINDLKRKLGC